MRDVGSATAGARWSVITALAIAACDGGVQIEAATSSGSGTGGVAASTSSGTSGASSSTSSGTGGASSSTSSGTGGAGGGCSVSLPAGCGCPDNPGPWVHAFSTPGADKATDVGVQGIGPDGSTVIRLATIDVDVNGNTWTLTSAKLAKLDAAGQILWELPDVAFSYLTPDPRDCSTVATGEMPGGSMDLLGHTITCSAATCPLAARLDASGSLVWVKVYDFGGSGWVLPTIAGVLADGRIALAGPFDGTIDLGNGPLSVPPTNPYSGIFVAMLSPDGDALWSRRILREHTAWFMAAAAVSPAGDIAVATTLDGGYVDFGAGPLAVPGSYPYGGLALASYDATGALLFGKAIGSASDSSFPSLARDSAGHLLVAQPAHGTMDYGGGPVSPDPAAWLTAVAAFDAGGQHLWSVGIDASSGPAIAVDAADHVWVGTGSSHLVELDPAGALVATHPLGGSGQRVARFIGFTPAGAPWIAGVFDGTLDLGSGPPLAAQSSSDAFVAALAP